MAPLIFREKLFKQTEPLLATYSVILATASGASQALTSKDKVYIERVVAALNDAIVKRG